MVLELVRDMPRGRAESLARMLVPMLVVMVVALTVLLAWTVDDARVTSDLRRQIEQQAETAGVLLLDDRAFVPTSGERDVSVLVDGRLVEGLIVVDGDLATLLVRSADGTFQAAVPGD